MKRNLLHYRFAFALTLFSLVGCAGRFNGSSPLFRSDWVLTEMSGVPVQQSRGEDNASVRFDYNNRSASGMGGCNRFNSSVDMDSKELSFGPIASTKMYCTDQQFEDRYLSELAKVRRYTIEDGFLSLRDDRRRVILKYRAR